MSTQPFDPAQYKAGQLREWDTAAAGWRAWWPTIEQGAQHVSDRLMELAEVQSGQRVLDIATGIGEPAVTAARRVGPGGRVVAMDQSPQMLAIARERAVELALHNLEFHVMDAEALDFPENSFDAVLCRFGLMFLPNLGEALTHIHRVLAPGGRLAAAVWDVPQKVPMVSVPMGVVMRTLELPPPPPEAPSPFALAAPDLVERALTSAGFVDVGIEYATVTMKMPSVEAYLQFMQGVAAPINALLSQYPAERRVGVWQEVSDALRQFVQPDGSVRMANSTICVVGRRDRGR